MAIKIKEYWIIDRFRRTLTVIRYRPRRPQILVVSEKQIYTTPLLPGFELSLAKLLAVSDKYRRSKPATSDQDEDGGLYVVDDDLD